jgi:hypothetical protein
LHLHEQQARVQVSNLMAHPIYQLREDCFAPSGLAMTHNNRKEGTKWL